MNRAAHLNTYTGTPSICGLGESCTKRLQLTRQRKAMFPYFITRSKRHIPGTEAASRPLSLMTLISHIYSRLFTNLLSLFYKTTYKLGELFTPLHWQGMSLSWDNDFCHTLLLATKLFA